MRNGSKIYMLRRWSSASNCSKRKSLTVWHELCTAIRLRTSVRPRFKVRHELITHSGSVVGGHTGQRDGATSEVTLWPFAFLSPMITRWYGRVLSRCSKPNPIGRYVAKQVMAAKRWKRLQ